jgi:hypothetical protein
MSALGARSCRSECTLACHYVAVKRAGLLLAVLVLVAVAGTLYSAAGWKKMESACLDGPKGQVNAGVSYSWSWQPLGFKCTYDDGTSETSLWPS